MPGGLEFGEVALAGFVFEGLAFDSLVLEAVAVRFCWTSRRQKAGVGPFFYCSLFFL